MSYYRILQATRTLQSINLTKYVCFFSLLKANDDNGKDSHSNSKSPQKLIDSRLMGITRFQLFCALSAAIGTINYGWNNGALNIPGDVISRCLTGPQTFAGPFPSCIPTNSAVWGIGVGAFPLGAACSSLVAGFLSNKYGRKPVLIWSNLFMIAGCLILSTSTTFAQIVVGRLTMGLQTGMASSTVSAYISEITTPRARTTLGALLQISVNVGICLSLTASLGLAKPPLWRILLFLSGITGLANMLLMRKAVESPRWLVNHNRDGDALQNLQLLRKGGDIACELDDYRQYHLQKQKEVLDITLPLESSLTHKHAELINGSLSGNSYFHRSDTKTSSHPPPPKTTISLIDIILNCTPHNLRHQLMVVLSLMVLQQFSGINAVVFYSTTIFQSIANSPSQKTPNFAQILAWVVSLTSAIAVLFGMYLISKFGRRTLLLFSHISMAICMLCMSLGLVYDRPPLIIAMVILYNIFFVLGAGPLPWTAAGEMTPIYGMSALTSIGAAVNNICSFTVGVTFPLLHRRLGNYTFMFYMGFNFLAALFIILFLPETRNRRIEDVVDAHSIGIHFAFRVPDVPVVQKQIHTADSSSSSSP